MKAKTTSIHSKLYSFTYDSDLPKNLCPYFWKLIWSVISFVPDFIIRFPALIINLSTKYKEGYAYFSDSSEKRGMGGAIWIAIWLLSIWVLGTYHLIKYWFDCYSYNYNWATVGGLFNIALILIALIIWNIVHTEESGKNIITQNILTETIKAQYNKYCPKIDWE